MSSKLPHWDVAVIGGGSAGLCAAIAAARAGAKTLLLEQSSLLGGMGTLANVHTFCGLYEPNTTQPVQLSNRGLPAEIESAMRQATACEPQKMGKVYVLLQNPDSFAKIAQQLCEKEPQLSVKLQSACQSIEKEKNNFLIHYKREGQFHSACSRTIVDTSANAFVAHKLNAPRHQVAFEKLQRPAYIFSLKNVPHHAVNDQNRIKISFGIAKAVKEKNLSKELLGTTFRASTQANEIYASIDLTTNSSWNPEDSHLQKEIEELGQSLAFELHDYLKTTTADFIHCSPPQFPKQIGIRESYRWQGDYTITADDLVTGITFPDSVAYASWPIELREDTTGPKFTFFQKAQSSQIPLSCLKNSDFPGVYFAGRCLSASHEALASVRVMGTCFATGQAAGIAAALHSQGTKETLEQAKIIRERI